MFGPPTLKNAGWLIVAGMCLGFGWSVGAWVLAVILGGLR